MHVRQALLRCDLCNAWGGFGPCFVEKSMYDTLLAVCRPLSCVHWAPNESAALSVRDVGAARMCQLFAYGYPVKQEPGFLSRCDCGIP
jgi:hypothetical protein